VLCAACLLLGIATSAQTSADYDALVQKGKTQLQASTVDLALDSGEAAIKMNADRWEGYALAGGALMNLKRYEEAADKLSEAIKRAPETKQTALRDLRRQCLLAESGTSPTQKETTSSTTTQAEVVMWKSIENSGNQSDFEVYLAQYPRGAFVALARKHIEQLQAEDEQRRTQIAAAKAREPIERPFLQGTLVKGPTGTVFLAIPSMGRTSTPVYLVSWEGKPSFLMNWTDGKNPFSGTVLFTREQVIIKSARFDKTIQTADIVLTVTHPNAHGQYDSPAKLRSKNLQSNLGNVILALENDDGSVTKFLTTLLTDWDNTLRQFASAGIDTNRLIDSSNFDILKETAKWDFKRYCMCPTY
jgi:tetratricopeptide (TPR) repeat protein